MNKKIPKNVLQIIALFSFAVGCQKDVKVSKPNTNTQIEKKRSFPIHGNFCGIVHPSYAPGDTREQHFQKLSNTEPLDSIDNACKIHDLCYLKAEFGSKKCDGELVSSIQYMRFDSSSGYKCESIRASIDSYFQSVHYNRDLSVMSVLGTAYAAPLTVLSGVGQTTIRKILMPAVDIISNPVNAISDIADIGIYDNKISIDVIEATHKKEYYDDNFRNSSSTGGNYLSTIAPNTVCNEV